MAEIEKVFAGLNTRLRKFKEEFGVEFTARAAEKTPVDTGALQRGWGFTMKQNDIEIYNIKDYASFIEYGTPSIEPVGMLRRTLLEKDEIAAVAAEKAKK